jgi:signal transduction histidine kinase/CheY-like chemotaxis protein
VTHPADTLPLLQSLGWLAALMFAAVSPGLPGGVGRRHAGWLFALIVLRVLLAAQGLVSQAGIWLPGADLLSASLLWEFARRTYNDTAARPVSAVTHLIAVECGALVAVITASGGPVHPGWFLPIDVLYAVLPGLLSAGFVGLIWIQLPADGSQGRRIGLHLALLGLGLHAVPTAVGFAAGGLVPPYLAATGLGLACFVLPATRTRAAIVCAAGLAAVAAVGPLLVRSTVDESGADHHPELLDRAIRLALPLQGRFAAEFVGERLAPDARETLRSYLERTRTADPLLPVTSLWQWRDGRLRAVDWETGEFVAARPSPQVGASGFTRAAPFVIPSDSAAGRPFVTVCAPLAPEFLDSPTAWLTLEFPGAYWTAQREHARQTGLTLVGALAVVCAMGFVLVTRQALEASQRLQLERTESASRAKTEFLAFLSHEMRTPLQTILGRAELLRHDVPAASRHADAIETQGRHLLRLVIDLLDLGTIEAGKLKLQAAPFLLQPLLDSLAEDHGASAAAKGLSLVAVVATAPTAPLLGDEARLRQILGNLLDNAVKYTATGTVTLRVAGEFAPAALRPLAPDAPPVEQLVFEVTDTGPGLPPEKIPSLFTLFTRLDSGATFTREGTGVGLALVRRLCDLMGGTVTAANRPEGGAVFTVRLALPRAAASPASTLSTSTPALAPATQHILVAEDNTAAREFLTEALRSLGHTVEPVADGLAALTAARCGHFIVALLDINLPLLDGIALARLLRAERPSLRLIGCSAEAGADTRDAAFASGMHAFLTKPVSLAELGAALSPIPPSAETAALSRDIFTHLASPATLNRTQAVLRAEWPQLRLATESALEAGDTDSLRRLAHYVHTTALLLDDHALGELCARVSPSAAPGGGQNPRALLAAFDSHFASWPPSR